MVEVIKYGCLFQIKENQHAKPKMKPKGYNMAH